ncbi:MAG: GIY-YIG nuclease family protein [Flavobacteriales bacterium]|nr:GIY-YIG nuclease family protein [Flavobacteriales bacterium]
MKESFIYILTNDNKTTLYIGVTSNLRKRLFEHKNGIGSKFTKEYNITNLIYFETFNNITLAIEREKQLKNWNRTKKNKLIEKFNPNWEFIEY